MCFFLFFEELLDQLSQGVLEASCGSSVFYGQPSYRSAGTFEDDDFYGLSRLSVGIGFFCFQEGKMICLKKLTMHGFVF